MSSHRRPPPTRRTGAALALAASIVLGAVATSGCFLSPDTTSDEAGGEGDDDDSGDSGDGAGGDAPPPPPPPLDSVCDAASQCIPVASTCCECPTFAVRADSGFDDGCGEVDCEPVELDCPVVEAACVDLQCQLVCTPVVTERVCEGRFARDSFGCLYDECGDARGIECDADPGCAQVPADCCGCAEGGAETAVPVGQVEAHLESLDCPADPACPGIDVCDRSQVARCLGGECALAPAPDDGESDGGPSGPGALCGTVEQPICPRGQVCVLNHPDAKDATQLGVGSCHPGRPGASVQRGVPAPY